jgi:hypothetical protein
MIKQRSDDKGNTYTKIDEKYVKNQGEAIKNTSKMESLNNRANANNGDKNHD